MPQTLVVITQEGNDEAQQHELIVRSARPGETARVVGPLVSKWSYHDHTIHTVTPTGKCLSERIVVALAGTQRTVEYAADALKDALTRKGFIVEKRTLRDYSDLKGQADIGLPQNAVPAGDDVA